METIFTAFQPSVLVMQATVIQLISMLIVMELYHILKNTISRYSVNEIK